MHGWICQRGIITEMKKRNNEHRSKNVKMCGRCGNTGITRKEIFICRFCGWPDGEEMDEPLVEITKGPLEI